MLLCVSAVVIAFFSPAIAWGLLLLPIAHLLVTAFAAGSASLRNVPELSAKANAMMRRWHHYYFRACFCTAARAVGFAAPAVAIIGCFHGLYLGLPLGFGICLLTFYLAPVFNPTSALRNPIDRQAHEEVIAFINNRREDGSTESATSPPSVGDGFLEKQPARARANRRRIPKDCTSGSGVRSV
ncbi:MAG TPA: hypothetical protein VIS71_03245 [Terrimicrobium sp.]